MLYCSNICRGCNIKKTPEGTLTKGKFHFMQSAPQENDENCYLFSRSHEENEFRPLSTKIGWRQGKSQE